MTRYEVHKWYRYYGTVEAASAREAVEKYESDPGRYEGGIDKARRAVARVKRDRT